MILQALKEYYDRKDNLPRYGFEEKEIPYVLILNRDGSPQSLECTYEGTGKARRAHKYLVPKGIKKTVNISANLLWENPEYAFGVVIKGRPDQVSERHMAFVERIKDLSCHGDEGIEAVKKYLARPNKVLEMECFGDVWSELLKKGLNVTFKLAGDIMAVMERPAVKQAIINEIFAEKTDDHGMCLVSGASEEIARLHESIKGVWGAKSTGANIVSFNLDAFNSYGKTQGDNAPVSKASSFAYTTALNHLLNKDSKQRLQVGDASTVFWAEKETEFESQLLSFFDEPPKDDPDRGTQAVESLFRAVSNGVYIREKNKTKFYVLGLAPNGPRISIRFWVVDTVEGMAQKICQHFEDVSIIHGPNEKNVLSLFRLLVSVATQGKSDNIPPNLAGDTIRSILEGFPYPRTLLQSAVQRTRAEQSLKDKNTGKAKPNVPYPRAGIIKACLNRDLRFNKSKKEEELKMSLDLENKNIGYRLGRLFAVLEKIQQEAQPGINATIRDKFYGAASGTPVTVFGNLMRLKNHHLAKLENQGRRVNFERLLGEVMSSVSDFPPHLTLDDQGRFAIGYYHQMQDFFTKKKDANITEGE